MSASFISDEWLTSRCNLIAARAATVPLAQRKALIETEIANLDVSLSCKIAIQNLMSAMGMAVKETMHESSRKGEVFLAFGFGLVFLVVILVAAFKYPNPTPFQFFVFRVVLSLAAAGIGGVLTGFIDIKLSHNGKTWLRAGGGLAVLVLVYLINPAKLILQ